MYLFFFAVLFIIFQYTNEKSIFEAQDSENKALTIKLEDSKIIKDSLQSRVADLNYFTLQGNENAMTYLENFGYNAKDVEELVAANIYDQNLAENGNPLIPFDGMNGKMNINKLKFLNHKWIQADFSDGKYWGEMIIEYYFDENENLKLNTIASLLYPN